MRTGILLACLGVLSLVLGSCAGASPPRDPFVQNRLLTLARAVSSARDARQRSTALLTDAIAQLREAAANGADPGKTYIQARRLLAVCESRHAEAVRRRRQLDPTAEVLFDEWRGEARAYRDESLQGLSRAKLDEMESRYRKVYNALKDSEGATDPVLRNLEDLLLYAKHNRDEAALPSLPATSDQGREAEAKLAASNDAAVTECTEFIDLVEHGRKPAPTPSEPPAP